VWIGSFHACGVHVANPNHIFEHPAFAILVCHENIRIVRCGLRGVRLALSSGAR
jgi:hypothetical protein